jgi:DNA mismatch endonuclease (patch repair protein)
MDKLTPYARSENMRRIKSKGMKPEMLVRRLVHGLGYRYRLHREDLPGKPDLVFGPKWKVIFVHGCFWHGHEKEGCLDSRMPKSNTDYWSLKLTNNKARDVRHSSAIREAGWDVLTIWECETKDEVAMLKVLRGFLD